MNHHTGDTMVATTIRVTNTYGAVTGFGRIVLLTNPVDTGGRVKLMLRHDCRSVWMWLRKYHDEPCSLDLIAPVTPFEQQKGVLPWMRATAYTFRVDINHHDPPRQDYVLTGWAEKHPKTGDVLRFRQDVTGPTGEEPRGAR